MKIAIIIPPWLHPTSPPLGPACLAAFLKREAKNTTTKVFDLNLHHYYQAFEYLDQGKIRLTLYNWNSEETAKRIKEAFGFLKSQTFSSVSLKTWHSKATIFLSFENIFNGFIGEMAARSLLDLKLPKTIHEYLQGLVEPVLCFKPDICAVSLSFDAQVVFGLSIAKIIKQRIGSFVCFGGARFGTSPEPGRLFTKGVTIKAKGKTTSIKNVSYVDAIVPGEGELPLHNLLNALRSGKVDKVPGVIIKKTFNHSDAVPLKPFDMNELPCPDFSDIPLDQYMVPHPVLPIMTSRGCAWGRCTFCTHHKSYNRYRQMKIQKLICHIKKLCNTYKIHHINIFDEMIPPARFRRLSQALLNNNIDITFSAYAKPTKAFDRELLGQIRKAGCQLMLWGIESGSQKILDLMGKGTKVEEMEQVLINSSKSGIKNLIFVMFGFPGETKEDFRMTLDFLKRTKDHIHAISKGLFVLVEGCQIQKNPDGFFIKRMKPISDNWGGATTFEFETQKGLNPTESAELYKQHLPFIEQIGLSPRLGVYREHLLF